jgi:RecA-family ATPase
MPKEVLNYKAYSISEFLDMPDTPQPYLVEGIVYEHGKTVLVGKPKTGKSWLTLKLGLSVALGEPLLGVKVAQASVVYHFEKW